MIEIVNLVSLRVLVSHTKKLLISTKHVSHHKFSMQKYESLND